MPLTGDFLGKLWVPATLLSVVGVVVTSIAVGQSYIGFMFSEIIVSISFLLRFTWDKRQKTVYPAIILGLLLLHIVAMILISPSSRGAGGVYMLAALLDGVIMTVIVNTVLSAN